MGAGEIRKINTLTVESIERLPGSSLTTLQYRPMIDKAQAYVRTYIPPMLVRPSAIECYASLKISLLQLVTHLVSLCLSIFTGWRIKRGEGEGEGEGAIGEDESEQENYIFDSLALGYSRSYLGTA